MGVSFGPIWRDRMSAIGKSGRHVTSEDPLNCQIEGPRQSAESCQRIYPFDTKGNGFAHKSRILANAPPLPRKRGQSNLGPALFVPSSLFNVRFTPESGHSANIALKARYCSEGAARKNQSETSANPSIVGI